MKKPSPPITPQLVKKVKDMLAGNQFFQRQIAEFFEINAGRISEIKNGKYDHILV